MDDAIGMKIALLIDAENISNKYIKLVFDELVKVGTPTYKRIYGDWTSNAMAGWKKVLLDYALIPMQQYSYTVGKNSTDSAMIIDAMDILYSGNVDGFCIVSSDSDFTRLILRLRESGKYVIGMGENKTPKSFINSCNRFTSLDLIQEEAEEAAAASKAAPEESVRQTPKRRKLEKEMRRALVKVVDELTADEELANIGTVNQRMISLYPDFDYRIYGFRKFHELLNTIPELELDEIKIKNSKNGKNIFVRLRRS